MIRLVLSDLVAQNRVWLGILTVTITTGVVGAVAAGLIETGVVHGGRVLAVLSSTSAAVIVFTAVTALVVLSSTTHLTVALQQRSYALWQIVGVRPALVAGVVLTQLSVVGALGATIGCLIGILTLSPLFLWVFRDWTDLAGVSVHLGPVSVLVVVASIVVAVLIAGLRGARRAGRTPPIESLRDSAPPRNDMGWFRIVLAVLTLVGTAALAWALDGDTSTSAFAGPAVLLTPLIAATLAAAGPLVFPRLLRAWTSLVPPGTSASWFLARNSARYRLGRSTAAISPLMIAIALAGGLYTTGATLAAAQNERTGRSVGFELAPEGVVMLLGGPLLLSAVAAAATVFMSSQAREREFALIQAAGSTHAVILLTAIWEAVIYTGTAVILGLLAVVAGGFVVAVELSQVVPVIALAPVGAIAGGGFALILAATVVPTAAALRHEIPRTLAVE